LGANCAGKNVDCAGNGAGLRNLVTNQIINLQHSSQTRQGENSVEMKNATKFLSLAIEIYPAVANLWLFFLTKA